MPREALNLPLAAIIEKHSHHHIFCFAEKKVNKPVIAESFTSKLFPPSIDDADDGNQEKFSRIKNELQNSSVNEQPRERISSSSNQCSI